MSKINPLKINEIVQDVFLYHTWNILAISFASSYLCTSYFIIQNLITNLAEKIKREIKVFNGISLIDQGN